jgi:hypothetical protein
VSSIGSVLNSWAVVLTERHVGDGTDRRHQLLTAQNREAEAADVLGG